MPTLTAASLQSLPSSTRTALERRVADGTLELPLLPESVSEVLQACQDEKCDLRRVAEILQRDASIAGNCLRIANSAIYAPPVPIVSLAQAASRLGSQKIRELALVVSSQSRIFSVKGHEWEVRRLFRHSLATARYAQGIARSRRWNVEEAFLCGLLHDVGKPVLLQMLVDVAKVAREPISAEAMTAVLEECHASLGQQLVARWKLPLRIGETILHHHTPLDAPSCTQTAMLTAFADEMAEHALQPTAASEAALRSHSLLEPLNLYPEEMDALLARAEEIRAMAEGIA